MTEWAGVGLLRAAKNGNARNVRLMLTRGSDVNAADETGATALMHSANNGHLESAQALLEAGADAEDRAIG
ncbi:MAG: ankyrin repeat domain-containing protein [Candidatus Latescibacterota bacterium]|jgi:ankyrin repeat protein|nr:ankyrin repeat domain-containing protein [Candidatus Latescibacterota bacterium]